MTKPQRRTLDARDLEIWNELQADPQVTNKAIAGRLNITEIDVARRLRRLDDNNLMRMSASIAFAQAGYSSIAHLFLGCAPGDERSIADQAQASSLGHRVISLHSIRGKSGVEVSIRIADDHEIETLVLAAFGQISGIKSYTLNIAYQILWARTDMMMPRIWSHMSISESAQYIRESVLSYKLDDLSSKIAAELQRDGRTSIREIARRYDVTEGTIRYRLRALLDRSLIRLGPVRHPITFNVRLMTRVLLQVLPADMDAVLKSIPQSALTFAARTTGEYNLHVVLATSDLAELNRLLEELRLRPEVLGIRSATMKDIFFFDSRWSVAQ